MNDPRSSRGWADDAKRVRPAPSDLGTKQRGWKDLGEVSRGQQDISFIHEGHERHEENHVFFIHEGHERHEEKILRKMVIDRLELPMELLCRSDGVAFASKLAGRHITYDPPL